MLLKCVSLFGNSVYYLLRFAMVFVILIVTGTRICKIIIADDTLVRVQIITYFICTL